MSDEEIVREEGNLTDQALRKLSMLSIERERFVEGEGGGARERDRGFDYVIEENNGENALERSEEVKGGAVEVEKRVIGEAGEAQEAKEVKTEGVNEVEEGTPKAEKEAHEALEANQESQTPAEDTQTPAGETANDTNPSFVSLSRELESKHHSKSSGSAVSPLEEDADTAKQKHYMNYIESSDLLPSNGGSKESKESKEGASYNDIVVSGGSRASMASEPAAPAAPAPRPKIDPSSVRIFSNQAELDMQKHVDATAVTGAAGVSSAVAAEDELPEGIARPLYIPAVIRKTEEKIDLSEYYKQRKSSGGASSPSSSLQGLFFGSSPVDSQFKVPEMRRSATVNSVGSGGSGGSSNIARFMKNAVLQTSPNSVSRAKLEVSCDHWKPDKSASKCKNCSKEFNIVRRKHHCRKCGEIFCDSCLQNVIKLDYDLNFKLFDADIGEEFISQHQEFANEIGFDVKSCRACYRQYKQFVQGKIRDLKLEESEEESDESSTPVETEGEPESVKKVDEKGEVAEDDGYDWSSF